MRDPMPKLMSLYLLRSTNLWVALYVAGGGTSFWALSISERKDV